MGLWPLLNNQVIFSSVVVITILVLEIFSFGPFILIPCNKKQNIETCLTI